MHIVLRIVVLCLSGYGLAAALLSLSTSRDIARVKDEDILSFKSWYTLCAMGFAAMTGLVVPELDTCFKAQPIRDIPTVFRSVLCYLGILLACVKFPNQDSLALALSIGMMVVRFPLLISFAIPTIVSQSCDV
eukprot:TRINITY_DN4259_c0_g1_i1.p2 TRINITY_DN4259_c0_g1~~TRINITY_DN4259_c0_g1_i1.p2  ORF type:complete len:133 (+),score=13.98 TRINITY_DN4259_c0_g1_i1:65-463(+)